MKQRGHGYRLRALIVTGGPMYKLNILVIR